MAKGGGDGVDTAAVRDAVERAVGLMEEVRRIKQQLTASKTSIDKAAEIVQTMADGVRGQLAEISGLIDRAEAAAASGEGAVPERDSTVPAAEGSDPTPSAGDTPPADKGSDPATEAEPEPKRVPIPTPRLRDELAAALGNGGQSTLL
jgi:hypothetical protein